MYLITMDDFQIRDAPKSPNGIQCIFLESLSGKTNDVRKIVKLVMEFDDHMDIDQLIDNPDILQLATQLTLKIKELGFTSKYK